MAADRLSNAALQAFVTNSTSLDKDISPDTARQWLLAVWMIRIRWSAVPLCLLLVPLFPTISGPYAVVIALTLGLGNAGIAWLLHVGPSPARLRLARRCATSLEWTVGLGILALLSHEPTSRTPALLLLLILLAAVRYGLPGLLSAVLASGVMVVNLLAAQVFVLDVLDAHAAGAELKGWLLLLVVTALVVGGLIQATAERRRWEQKRWNHYGPVLQRLECGLTERELALLPLLANEALTYAAIAADQNVRPETIKTHARHLGAKLGVSGRHRIVAAARRRGLLPPEDTPPTVD